MLKFKGTISLADGWARIEIDISDPQENAEGDFCCLVYAPPILKKRTKIFGVDENQARQLSIKFIDDLVDQRTLCDLKGQLVKVSDLL